VLTNSMGDFFDVWLPYTEWECYQDGMWKDISPRKEVVKRAKIVLANPGLCVEAMKGAVINYRHSAMHHLSKYHSNRNPWMGQSACCYLVGATEEETRIAWSQMNQVQQIKANEISQNVIKMWERQCLNAD
jgi:hypothetical protein